MAAGKRAAKAPAPEPEVRVVEKRVEVDRPWAPREVAPGELVAWWDAGDRSKDEVHTVHLRELGEWVAVSGDGGTRRGFVWQILPPRSAKPVGEVG